MPLAPCYDREENETASQSEARKVRLVEEGNACSLLILPACCGLFPTAPHDKLTPGARLQFYERGTGHIAEVEILDWFWRMEFGADEGYRVISFCEVSPGH